LLRNTSTIDSAAQRLLPRMTTGRRPSLDPVGVAGVSGALALALIPLIPLVLGRRDGWPPWTWVLLAASAPAMVLALICERRLARRGGSPLLNLSLFSNRTFSAGLLNYPTSTSGALTWATRYARTRGGQNADFMQRGMEKLQVRGHEDGRLWAFCKTVG